MTRESMTRAMRGAAVGLVLVALAGCSGADMGVELNGKIFDAVGMSGAPKRGAEPKLAERAPLVPPPRTDALPAPGEATATNAHMAWPNDPDKRRAAAAAEAKKTVNQRCSDPMIGRPEPEREERRAECAAEQGGILSAATSWMTGKSNKAEAAETTADEGDPGSAGNIKTGSTTPATKPTTSTKTR